MNACFLTLLVAFVSPLGGAPSAPVGPDSGPGQLFPLIPGIPPPILKLRQVQVVEDAETLRDVTSIVIDPTGRHAYTAAFNANRVGLFDRNPRTGELTLRNTYSSELTQAVVAFRLSPDGRFGAAASFRSDALVVYRRDLETGELTEIGSLQDENWPGLNFCIDAVFSPDSRFVHSVGSRGITVVEVRDDGIRWIQNVSDADHLGGDVATEPAHAELREMAGGRGIAASRDGSWIASTWNSSGCLILHRRDPRTGELSHFQTLRDDEVNRGLTGVMRVAISDDSRFIHTSGGRFGGLDAVCVFEVPAGGQAVWHQSILGEALGAGFGGGNEIVLSPTEDEVAVACTRSDHVVRFSRNPLDGTLADPSATPSGPEAAPGPAGVCYSPDGRHLYSADEKSHAVVVFRREKR